MRRSDTQKQSKLSYMMPLIISIVLMALATVALASGDDKGQGLGDIAKHITTSFKDLGKLIIGTAYLAGLGFGVAGVFKFKQHRDNPTQIPLGTPLALLGVGVVLVFLPSVFAPTGQTIFGKSEVAGGFKGEGASHLPSSKSSNGGSGS